MQLVDTNIILRYVLVDDEELSPLAKAIIQAGDAMATVEVLTEAVYVLKSVYGVPRREISECLINFIESSGITMAEEDVVIKALSIFMSNNSGFIDCILAAYATVRGLQAQTFDKDLRKLISNMLVD